MRKLAFLLLLTAAAGAQTRPAGIRLATVMPSGTSYHQILQKMGQAWRQAPGGGVNLTIYAGSSMGGEADIVRRMRQNQLQAGMLSVVGLSDIDKSVTALSYMPMMFRTLDELDYIRDQLRVELEKRLLDKGFVTLFWGDAGWVRFFTKEPVLHPADLRRLKLFAWAGDNYQIDLMKSVGFQPVALETSDILPGLQTGLISAVSTAPFYALATQVYGPAPHMLDMNWAVLVGATVITANTWQAIPPAAREALQKAADTAGAEMRKRGRQEAEDSVQTMVKRGLKPHPVTPEIEAEWRRTAEDVYPKIRGNMVPTDVFDKVQRLLTEYRARQGKPAK
ncbi:MAG: TRAP transporter substrate-binding protein DctP [Bryobacterales bacterium]|nr:TRAP transporter substrate-binding protein DctP [Bryobacterales bacterium]